MVYLFGGPSNGMEKLWRGDFNFDLSCDETDTPPDCDVNELAANLSATDVSCAGAPGWASKS